MKPPIPNASLNRRVFMRAVAWGAVLGAGGAWATELGRMLLTRNRHTVIDGLVYRTGQLRADQLESFVQQYHIKTVVNLRGRPVSDWYVPQTQVTQRLGVSQEDITTSANRLPAPSELRRLVEVFDHSEYPLVIHCQQGADRTGLAAAMVLLLHTNTDYETARRQCSPRFGHVGMFNTTIAMDRFFTQYEEWLAEEQQTHSPVLFRRWATTVYQPGPAVAELQLLGAPVALPIGQSVRVVVRATNRSRVPWHFKRGTNVGINLRYSLAGPNGETFSDRAGLFDAVVPPRLSIDIPIALPPATQLGRYRLRADLSERNFDFVQYGSEPLTYDWNSYPPARAAGS